MINASVCQTGLVEVMAMSVSFSQVPMPTYILEDHDIFTTWLLEEEMELYEPSG